MVQTPPRLLFAECDQSMTKECLKLGKKCLFVDILVLIKSALNPAYPALALVKSL